MAIPTGIRRHINAVLVIVFCVLGLVQIVPAVRYAAQDRTGDLGRQWVVTQYAIRGVNPYPIAARALLASYGALAPNGPVHLRDAPISDIPKLGPDPHSDPLLGTPEATYPPGSVMMLVPLGFLPRETVALLWLLVNLALVFLVAWELKVVASSAELGSVFFLGLVAVWPAVSICIWREQFSLLCLYCILVAHRVQGKRPIEAGLLYSFALLKPSLAIPFLALPLLESNLGIANRIRTLGTLAASQLALLGGMSWMVRANPGDLIVGWLRVAAYFRQGIYTVQEVINRLRFDGSAADFGLQIGILLCGIFLAYKAQGTRRLAILAIVSCSWTYHARYDFVILLIPAAMLGTASVSRRRAIELVALAIIGIGLLEPVYHGTGTTSAVLRMVARLSMVTLLIVPALSWLGERRTLQRKLNERSLALSA